MTIECAESQNGILVQELQFHKHRRAFQTHCVFFPGRSSRVQEHYAIQQAGLKIEPARNN